MTTATDRLLVGEPGGESKLKEGSMTDLMKNVTLGQAEDAVDVLDGSFSEKEDGKKHDKDFDAFASDSSLQVHAAVEATPVSHDPSAALNEHEIEAEKDPELVVHVEEEERAPNDNVNTRDRARYVTPKDFELLKVIGMGAFGKVLQVRNKQSKQVVAMKVISKRLLKRKSGYIENVQAERDIMTKIRHPFVVTMHCSFQTRDKLFIIMDFLAGGELFLKLGREGIFLENTAAFYLAEIILALDHLHTHGILHRDLKPENVLLSSTGHCCLTDFGLAKDFGGGFRNEEDESRARTVCGTQEYMAPEMVARKGYGRAADYWSLGCITYEMLSGLPPFTSKQGSKDLFRKIMSERVKMPPGSTAAACKLLKGLLNRNVSARLGASRGTMFEIGGVAGLKQMPFFKSIDWEKLERMEIDPPHQLHVDNDEDLRHFHDEFVNMPLPRSVTEMSMEHAQPRRCDSDVFRGFSFVQNDWALPDRESDEVERYWTHTEEDGESISECASSKLDLGEVQEAPAVPEKKKRPPRKRKKKKAAGTLSPMPSENGDAVVSNPPQAVAVDNGARAVDRKKGGAAQSLAEPEPDDTNDGTKINSPVAPALSLKERKTQQPKVKPPQKPQEEEWQSVGATTGKKKESAGSMTPKQTPARSAVHRANGPERIARQTVTQQIRRSAGRPATTAPQTHRQTHRPAPGSWAAKTSSQLSSPRAFARGAQPQQNRRNQMKSPDKSHLEPPPLTVSPSGDWRKHIMVHTNVHTQLPPPPIETETKTWPALGDFPAMDDSGASGPTGNKTSTPPKGAWATK